MNPQIESKIRRIEKMSAWLRAGCTGMLVLISVFFVVAVIALLVGRWGDFRYFDRSVPISRLSDFARAALAFLCVLTGIVGIKSLYHIRRLLDNYTRREIFTLNSARQIRQLGVTCLFWAVVKTAWAFMPLVVFKPADQTIALPLDTFVVGGVIIVIASFTEMAAVLREENELTI